MDAICTAKSIIVCLFICLSVGGLGCESDGSQEEPIYEAALPPMNARIPSSESEPPPVTPDECVTDLTDLSVEEIYAAVEENELPVVLTVSAHGCGYCREYMKDFKKVCVNYYGVARFVTVNVSDVYERDAVLLTYYQGHTPTTHFYYEGEEFRKISGKLEKEELIEAVDEFLAEVAWVEILWQLMREIRL